VVVLAAVAVVVMGVGVWVSKTKLTSPPPGDPAHQASGPHVTGVPEETDARGLSSDTFDWMVQAERVAVPTAGDVRQRALPARSDASRPPPAVVAQPRSLPVISSSGRALPDAERTVRPPTHASPNLVQPPAPPDRTPPVPDSKTGLADPKLASQDDPSNEAHRVVPTSTVRVLALNEQVALTAQPSRTSTVPSPPPAFEYPAGPAPVAAFEAKAQPSHSPAKVVTMTAKRNPASPVPVYVSYAGVAPHIWPLHAWAPPRRGEPTVPEIVPGDDQLPRHPLMVARSLPVEEGEVATWVEGWAMSTIDDLDDSEPSLQNTQLSTVTLVTLGRAIGFVDGDAAAIPWYVTAITTMSSKSQGGMDAATVAALRVIARPLYDARQWTACERVYAKLVGRYVPGTDEGRKVDFLHAETLYLSGQCSAAWSVLESLAAQNSKWNDLNENDRAEMCWVQALTLYREGRYEEALPLLKPAADTKGYSYAKDANLMLLYCLAKTGDAATTARELRIYVRQFPLNQTDLDRLVFDLKVDLLRAKQLSSSGG